MDECEVDERGEGGVEFVVACGDAPPVLEAVEEAFYLVALGVFRAVQPPGFLRLRLGGTTGL